MTWETFQACIDNSPKGTTFHFSGLGEPWINPRCTDMVMYAHEAGMFVKGYSTLSHTSIEDLERMKDVPFLLFQVHVPDKDGLFSEEKLRQAPEKYKALKENIQGLRITCVGGEPVDWAKDIFGDMIEVVEVWPRAGHLDNGLAIIPTFRKVKCGKYLMKHMVWPDGTVCVCCIDFQNDFPIGNLTDPNFFEEREAKLQPIIEQQLNPLTNIICKHCEFAIEVN